MTEAEKRGCEGLARQSAIMGRPLFVPPLMYAELKRQGVDLTNIRATPQIPVHA